MTDDDATLSDFAETDGAEEERDGDDGSDGTDESDTEGATADGTDIDADSSVDGTGTDSSAEPTGAAEPSGDSGLSTYAWGEYTCSRCGTETDRVWRSDGDLVCSGCKSW